MHAREGQRQLRLGGIEGWMDRGGKGILVRASLSSKVLALAWQVDEPTFQQQLYHGFDPVLASQVQRRAPFVRGLVHFDERTFQQKLYR